jgi:hypothetical protein
VPIDAIPVSFDRSAFLKRFLARWPERSEAHVSYFRRIVAGPDHSVDAAIAAAEIVADDLS